MKAFPMFIKTTGRRVVIVGGGEQAAQKARLILKTDADIVIAAADLDEELNQVVQEGRAEHYDGPLVEELFVDAAMVFVATGCFAIDVAAHALAKAARAPVNVVDQPHLCDLTTPSLVDRDPVVIAIGTEGTGPVLGQKIKTILEESLPSNLGGLAALAGRLRTIVSTQIPRSERRAFWRWVFNGQPAEYWSNGEQDKATDEIQAAIKKGELFAQTRNARVSFISAIPGERDLMTLRAIQRLQDAEVVYFSANVDHDVLELPRRDAEREMIPDESEINRFVQRSLSVRLAGHIKKKRKVVWIGTDKVTDKLSFGKVMSAIDLKGLEPEVVPSTSASLNYPAPNGQYIALQQFTDSQLQRP